LKESYPSVDSPLYNSIILIGSKAFYSRMALMKAIAENYGQPDSLIKRMSDLLNKLMQRAYGPESDTDLIMTKEKLEKTKQYIIDCFIKKNNADLALLSKDYLDKLGKYTNSAPEILEDSANKWILKFRSCVFNFSLIYEVETFEPGDGSSNDELFNILKEHKKDFFRENGFPYPIYVDSGSNIGPFKDTYVPSLDLLYTIKKSHRFKKDSPHFWKTAKDYHTMKHFGAEVPKYAEKFLRLRERESYTHTTPALNVAKNKFFTSNVNYTYEHDDIHEAVKIGNVPAYTLYMKEGQEVMCDKEKFLSLPLETRLNGVLEECFVLAIERSIVPFRGVLDHHQAFKVALSKVSSSITGGWFREFAYEHIPVLLKKAKNHNYVRKFEDAISRGKVRRYQKIANNP